MSELFGLYRGDEFLDVGTAEEIASRQGLTARHVRRLTSACYKRRQAAQERLGRSRVLVAVRFELDDGEGGAS